MAEGLLWVSLSQLKASIGSSPPPGDSPDRDVCDEEACGSHHRLVPCGRKSVHQASPAGPAATLDLHFPHALLGLLADGASLLGGFR